MSRKKDSLQAKNTQSSITLTREEDVVPPPTLMEEYKKVDPNFIEFFIDHAKKEQAHRIFLTGKQDRRQYKLARGEFWINIIGIF